MVCVVPPSHALAGAKRISLSDLANESLISYPGDTPHGQAVAAMFQASGLTYRASTTVRFAETAVIFVEQGLGVALVDDYTAAARASNVRIIPVEGAKTLPIFLNRNKFLPRSAVSETFERLTLAEFAPAR